MTDKELWERVKPYALSDNEFLDKIDERQVHGIAWTVLKWLIGSLFGLVMMYAPNKAAQWFNEHYETIKGK